jgi:ribosomal protein S12 methylthiotransferase
MRGKFRSRPLDSTLTEAEFLARNGKKELILVSQEATLWGQELPGRPKLIDLLREIDRIEDVLWIRPMYLYPAQLDNRTIDYFGSGRKVLPYFDLPLQHINSDILRGMHRQIDRPTIDRLLVSIRERVPQATIRTTFIVGFPGESAEQFGELCEFVEEQRFDRMGVFPYSAEEGTPAAEYGRQVPDEVKAERVEILMDIQREIALEKNERMVGQVVDVLIDEVRSDGSSEGRTMSDCPDIDQIVFVCGEGLAVGDLVRVKIDSVDGYDLNGSIRRGES